MWPLLALLALAQDPLPEPQQWVTLDDGIQLTPPGPLSLELHGRTYLESLSASGHDTDSSPVEGGQSLRSARLQAAWSAGEHIQGKAQWDFAGGEVDFKEFRAWVDHEEWRVSLGQQREPAGLDALRSSGANPFPERSAPTQAFTPGRNLGLVLRHRAEAWGTWVGAFRASEEASFRPVGDTRSVTARTVWTSGGDGTGESLLHLGLWSSYRDDGLRFRARPGSSELPRLIDTGELAGAEAWTTGLEAAWQHEGWTLAAEFMGSEIQLDGAGQATLNGTALEASWRPAGENRSYSMGKATFGGFTPRNPRGALEFAVNAAHTDLNSADIYGGSQTDLGFGLNVQLSKLSRWMLHFQESHTGDARVQSVLLRLQMGY